MLGHMVPFFCLWILVSTAVVDSQLSADQTILLQIPSTSSDFQTKTASQTAPVWQGWNSTSYNSTWSGVTFDQQGRVISLSLKGLKLTGSIPSAISLLTSLQFLDLSGNQFTGTLPASWGQTMKNVTFLTLNGNQIDGSIPPEWGQNGAFRELTMLILEQSKNRMVGTLPNWGANGTTADGSLAKLETFYLCCQGLKGPLPPSWVNQLKSLKHIGLWGNLLTGTLPGEWAKNGLFTKLEQLDIGRNFFTGPLPVSWGTVPGALPALAHLQLFDNQLTGSFPPEWGLNTSSLPSLTEIQLQFNSMNGSIPSAWPNSLAGAILAPMRSNAGLCGTVPASFPALKFVGPTAPSFHDPVDLSTLLAKDLYISVSSFNKTCPGSAPSPSPAELASSSSSAASFSTGAIAGVAVGAAILVVLLLAGLLLWQRRSAQRKYAATKAGSIGFSGTRTRSVFVSGEMDDTDIEKEQMAAKSSGMLTASTADGKDSDQFMPWESGMSSSDIVIDKTPEGEDWILGAGAYGRVFRATWKKVDLVAVKSLLCFKEDNETFAKEIQILKACRHPHIVGFLGACRSEGGNVWIVTEYLPGGNLYNALAMDRGEDRKWSWGKRGKRCALDIARGLHYLHHKNIVHFDLKSPNVLLARDGTAKIADYGLAKVLKHDDTLLSDVKGTFDWAAPEQLNMDKCSTSTDVFAYGVVLAEIVTGEAPSRRHIRDPKVPEECPQAVADLIKHCLQPDPAARPSMQQVVERILELE